MNYLDLNKLKLHLIKDQDGIILNHLKKIPKVKKLIAIHNIVVYTYIQYQLNYNMGHSIQLITQLD